MQRNAIVLLACVLSVVLIGCGSKTPQKTTIDLNDVPPSILKIAKEKLPGVTFTSAYKEPNGSYELRGKEKSGKVREIDIRPDGVVEELD